METVNALSSEALNAERRRVRAERERLRRQAESFEKAQERKRKDAERKRVKRALDNGTSVATSQPVVVYNNTIIAGASNQISEKY